MVRPERFELPTSWFVARRSIQLSYGRVIHQRLVAEREGLLGLRPRPCGTAGAAPASPSLFVPTNSSGRSALHPTKNIRILVAEREGFEPSMGF